MTKENRQLFEVLKIALWGETSQGIHVSGIVRKELRLQTVEGLTAHVSPDTSSLKYVQAARFVQMAAEQAATIHCLQEAGIPVVVIKGTAAGIYYPMPYLRTYGDIDLLVHPNHYHTAIECLKGAGYEQEGEIGRYHCAFQKSGFLTELHQCSPGLDDVKEGQYIHLFLLSGLESIQEGSIDTPKCSFPMLPWKQNGLELIWHFREHLYNGIGLRHAIDWMMFVHACLDDTAFVEYKDVLEKAGLLTLAKTVTRMCQIYIGLSESITWCKDASDELCKELMDYILEQGNFGHKRTDDKATKVLSRYRTPISFIKGMQRKGLEEWKLCKKHRILRPFAWVYTAVEGMKYLSKGGLSKLKSDRIEQKKRQRMFDQLYG